MLKYVIIQRTKSDSEEPLFCTEVTEHRQLVPQNAILISAGFCSEDSEGVWNCYGKSVSLDVESRPEKDTMILTRLIRGYW